MLPYIIHQETNNHKKNEIIPRSFKSSQIINFSYFVVSSLMFLISCYAALRFHPYFLFIGIFSIFVAIERYAKTWYNYHELTDERLIIHSGLFKKITFEIKLYRVKNIRLEEPFLYRIFKKGNIILTTSQETVGTIILPGIDSAKIIMKVLEHYVELRRSGIVREIDTYREVN